MTSNNEINNNTFASNDAFVSTDSYASTDAKADELKVTNLNFNNNDCCIREEEKEEEEWRQQFDTTDEEQMKDNYENCKFQLDYNSEPWSTAELTLFLKQVQDYEASHLEPVCFSSEYDDAVNLWNKYGLTHQQYDAYLVYENAVCELKAYYDLGEDDAEYENTLKIIIDTYETQMDADLDAQKKAEDANDWWINSNDCCGISDSDSDRDGDSDSYNGGDNGSDRGSDSRSVDLMEELIDSAAENEKEN